MPIVFETVETEISGERGSGSQRAQEPQDTGGESSEGLRKVMRELAIAEERKARIQAD
ncbi:MAG TPA: hypothetical protein VHP37_19765 [Burkholderiales bacterium]|nr:hypothetical protein [Burkholderiales bacterium]